MPVSLFGSKQRNELKKYLAKTLSEFYEVTCPILRIEETEN
jgi:hypothetical protein